MRRWRPVVGLLLACGLLLLAGSLAFGQQQDYAIGTAAFQRVWEEQDGPVAAGVATDRSWTWGPQPVSPLLREPMTESPGGTRAVQYFDKSRMEVTDPTADQSSPWYVTNGLLPIEMMNGRVQVGFADFVTTAPARISAVGDPDTYPTYADLTPLYQSPGETDPAELGQPVTRLLRTDGTIGVLDDYRTDPATLLRAGENGHAVPQGFLDFQNSQGIIYRSGQAVQGQVYNPLFVFGLPVTRAYWVNSRVGGQAQAVLFQVFERRVLTYNPANPPGSRVEMGNVGQHFYRWRYLQEVAPLPTETPTPDPATGPKPTATATPEPGAAPKPTATSTPAPSPTAEASPMPTATRPPQIQPPQTQPSQVGLFGMNTYITGLERNEQDGDAGVAQLLGFGRELGVAWAREELSWANLEPNAKGEPNYQFYDERVLQLSQAGYQVVGVVMTTPGWARVGDCAGRDGRLADYWCPPANPQDFGDFMRTLVEHYDGDGNADAPGSPRVAVWQIWNEPSTRGTWPGTPAEYGALLVAGYQGAKAADATALVLTGGVYLYDGLGTDPNDGLPFLNQAIAAVPDAANSFDGLAIHPYMPTAAPDAPVIFSTITLWGRIANAQGWLREQSSGRNPRPLWISEIGWSTCRPGQGNCTGDVAKSEQQQANYLVRSYAIALAQGVQHVSYFQLEDKFDGGSGQFWGEASILGTAAEGYRKKPAYQAYRVLQQQLGGLQFTGSGAHNTFTYDPTIENPEDLYHLRFAGGGVLVDLLWRNAGSQQVTFATEPGYRAEWISRDGNVTPISGSTVSLQVSEQPIYVRQQQ